MAKSIDCPEIQADTIEEVAKFSSKYASDFLKEDTLKNDFNLISNDQTLIGMKDNKLYAFVGTKFLNLRYSSISENVPSYDTKELFKKRLSIIELINCNPNYKYISSSLDDTLKFILNNRKKI